MKKTALFAISVISILLTASACTENQHVSHSALSSASQANADSAAWNENSTESYMPFLQKDDDGARLNDEISLELPEDSISASLHIHPLLRHEVRSYYDGADGRESLSCSCENLVLQDEDAAQFPELAKALEERCAEDAKAVFNESFRQEASEYASMENTSWYLGPYEQRQSVGVERSDSNVFSYTRDSYLYTGGAHGMFGKAGFSFDPKTGRKIGLKDAFTDSELLAQTVYNQLIESYNEFLSPDSLLDDIRDRIEGDKLIFVLTYTGARVFFNPYEIATPASGTLAVDLLFLREPELFNSIYCDIPDSFIMSLGNKTVYCDIDGDGLPESIRQSWLDGGPETDCMTILIGDERLEQKIYANYTESFLVKSKETVYVYVFALSNDETMLTVFDLAEGAATLGGHWAIAEPACQEISFDNLCDDTTQTERSGCTVCYTLTDPDCMFLDVNTSQNGDVGQINVLRVGDNGIPTPIDSYLSDKEKTKHEE